MSAHVLNLELQLVLRALVGALKILSEVSHGDRDRLNRTLKARCSRKWAVPLVLSVSDREPASIHTPTVEVWAHGECSVAIYKALVTQRRMDWVFRMYRESVGEGGGLGGGRQCDGRSKASLHGLNRLQSRTALQSLVKVES